MKRALFILLFFALFSCKNAISTQNAIVASDSRLIEYFKTENRDYPNISVHRGGKGLVNYPENCLETMQYIHDSISVFFEVDVSETKDGRLILMHDKTLDRTTTGSGLVKNYNYSDLQDFHLVDDYNSKTKYKIPLFSEVLRWCKANDAILTVDIKRSVEQERVIKAIIDAEAQDYCIIITYDTEQAKTAHKLAPQLLLSVSARNEDEFNRLLESKIPTKNMLAFTGTTLSSPTLFDSLHANGIVCMLGTLGNLDKQAEAKGDYLYREWHKIGADIMATDRPFEAFNAINN